MGKCSFQSSSFSISQVFVYRLCFCYLIRWAASSLISLVLFSSILTNWWSFFSIAVIVILLVICVDVCLLLSLLRFPVCTLVFFLLACDSLGDRVQKWSVRATFKGWRLWLRRLNLLLSLSRRLSNGLTWCGLYGLDAWGCVRCICLTIIHWFRALLVNSNCLGTTLHCLERDLSSSHLITWDNGFVYLWSSCITFHGRASFVFELLENISWCLKYSLLLQFFNGIKLFLKVDWLILLLSWPVHHFSDLILWLLETCRIICLLGCILRSCLLSWCLIARLWCLCNSRFIIYEAATKLLDNWLRLLCLLSSIGRLCFLLIDDRNGIVRVCIGRGIFLPLLIRSRSLL